MSARKAGSCRGVPPSTRAEPPVGQARPVSSRSSVDLPAPLGPTSALIRPWGTVTEQSLSAVARRYRLVSAAVSIAGPPGSAFTRSPLRIQGAPGRLTAA
jgi:hypothetical protein